MKALVYLGPRRMELQDVAEPGAGPGEVLVEVRASAICGSDLHGFREASPRRIPPLVMGHEVAGVVRELGDGVDPAIAGRRVVAKPVVSCGTCARCTEGRPNLCPNRRLMGMDFPGGFAEAFALPADHVLPVPDALEDDLATLTEPFANAIHAVTRSVREGDTVLVIGAGAIGSLAVRAAVLAGAERVLVSDPLPSRRAVAQAQGARPIEDLEDVLSATDGDGVDVVIDAAGFPPTWKLALGAVRFGGRIEAIGLGAPEGPIDYHPIVAKGVTITGSYACVDEDFDRALALLENDRSDLASWITAMPLADGANAFERLVDVGDLVKVVLHP